MTGWTKALLVLGALALGGCAAHAPDAVAEGPLADVDDPSLFCRQVIAAVVMNQEQRLLDLMLKVPPPETRTAEQRRQIAFAAQGIVGMSRGMLDGPAKNRLLHKETVLKALQSHLTMESWEGATGRSMFFGCSLTPGIGGKLFAAMDQPSLEEQVTAYYRDVANGLAKSSLPPNRI